MRGDVRWGKLGFAKYVENALMRFRSPGKESEGNRFSEDKEGAVVLDENSGSSSTCQRVDMEEHAAILSRLFHRALTAHSTFSSDIW